MKSSLKKLRGLTAIHKHDHAADKQGLHPPSHLDELHQAAQDMEDMKNCYDSLLAAAAATANSAYEFSESMREMGSCLLEKTALNDDESSGRALLMLGKVQFDLQKLVDKYRTHIFQTITTPSESLLSELRTVEDMKRQCDDKRVVYDEMMAAFRKEKGRVRNARGDHILSQQLQTAHAEYDEEATLFVFRLKSLKQGQSRSLLTQAARHHAAQLNFFKKAVRSLEAVEPHIKLVAEQQHIDYQFRGLEDDDQEEGDEDGSLDTRDDGELSFDYGHNERGPEVSTSRNSMELDQIELTVSAADDAKEGGLDSVIGGMPLSGRRSMSGSQSAPIFPDKKLELGEITVKDVHAPTKRFYSYVLPTPLDAKRSVSAERVTGSPYVNEAMKDTSTSGHRHYIWHSSPLEPYKPTKGVLDEQNSGKLQKESNINSVSSMAPPPLAEGLSQLQTEHHSVSDSKKIKRQSFSGPISTKPWSSKSNVAASSSTAEQSKFSLLHHRSPVRQSSTSPKVSPNASPPPVSSPRISELHELPRPPLKAVKATRPFSLVGHSAPLVPRSQELSMINKPSSSIAPHAASPLPAPPAGTTVPRSFSIPSRGQRAASFSTSELLNLSRNSDVNLEVPSPPLTPIYLANAQPSIKTGQSTLPSPGN